MGSVLCHIWRISHRLATVSVVKYHSQHPPKNKYPEKLITLQILQFLDSVYFGLDFEDVLWFLFTGHLTLLDL